MFMVRSEIDFNRIVLVCIARQTSNFFIDTIVDEVCKEILPLNAQEQGYYAYPANPMYNISPNRDFIKIAVMREINEMLAGGKIIAQDVNGVVFYRHVKQI